MNASDALSSNVEVGDKIVSYICEYKNAGRADVYKFNEIVGLYDNLNGAEKQLFKKGLEDAYRDILYTIGREIAQSLFAEARLLLSEESQDLDKCSELLDTLRTSEFPEGKVDMIDKDSIPPLECVNNLGGDDKNYTSELISLLEDVVDGVPVDESFKEKAASLYNSACFYCFI